MISKFVKRSIDILLSLLAMILLSPVVAVIAFLVRRRLGSPIFFRQVRAGLDGAPFKIVKFRTMTDARDAHGNLLPDVDRLPPFGKFLRSSSLDELPELWNVLIGDMSLVGPRPLLMRYLPRYSVIEARRHEVRPGVTGWAQINGRNALSWPEKLALDVWYVDNRSFQVDMRVLMMTVVTVLRRDGISAAGEATMPEFMGSEIPPRT